MIVGGGQAAARGMEFVDQAFRKIRRALCTAQQVHRRQQAARRAPVQGIQGPPREFRAAIAERLDDVRNGVVTEHARDRGLLLGEQARLRPGGELLDGLVEAALADDRVQYLDKS